MGRDRPAATAGEQALTDVGDHADPVASGADEDRLEVVLGAAAAVGVCRVDALSGVEPVGGEPAGAEGDLATVVDRRAAEGKRIEAVLRAVGDVLEDVRRGAGRPGVVSIVAAAATKVRPL